ncbi:MAG: hypothetical protein KDG55_14830 [Rhodocyclaceae bacterium]|nr:hypothetical protein [Rhodocyclaceae bacterium]
MHASLIADDATGAAADPEADAWMSRISALPPEQACRLIEERLNMLEAAHLPVGQFVPALGLIQDAITTLHARIDAALPRTEMRFSAGELELVKSLLALLKRTASAFVDAAGLLDGKWFPGASRRIRDDALQQGALAVLLRVELAHRIYARSSTSGWQQLLRISTIAISRKARVAEAARAEIARLHTRAVLFELADPNRLDPIYFEHLRMYLRRHGGQTRIVRLQDLAPDKRRDPGLHLLDPAGRSSQPASRVDASRSDGDWLVLDARPLVKRIERQLTGLSAGVDTARLGLPRDARQARYHEFLAGLGERWGQRSTRRHTRSRFLPRTQLAIGLGASRELLADPDAAARQPAGGQVAINPWSIVNESPAGFALAQIAPTGGVRIGEPCCLRPDGRPDAHVGIIRRAEQRGPRDLVIGIELLGSGARPASVQSPSSEDGTEETPLIHFARSSRFSGPTLLCRAGRLRAGETVVVRIGDHLEPCRVTELAAVGGQFELASLAGST